MLVALASAAAIAILMPAGPDEGCPSPRQVSEALSSHLPGMVLPLGRPPGPNTLRLSVTGDAGGTLRVDLSDPDGGALLRRRVAPEVTPRAKAGDCAALAETAALIVDRYWHEVGYEVPPAPPPAAPKPPPPPAPPPPPPPGPPKPAAPPPPPAVVEPPARPAEPPALEAPSEPLRPPDWWLAAGVAGEATSGEENTPASHGEMASVVFAIEQAVGTHRLGLEVSAGDRTPKHPSWLGGKGQAAVSEVPVGLAVYLAFPIGLGRIEPGIGVELNVIYLTSRLSGRPDSGLAAAPGLDGLLAWTVPVVHDFFFRLEAAGAVAVPEKFSDDSDPTNKITIFVTPRFRAALGLQLGFWFR